LEVVLRLRAAAPVVGTLAPDGTHRAESGVAVDDGELVWKALATGRTSLALRGHGSARHFVLVDTPPWSRLDRALHPLHAVALRRLASGEQAKAVAHSLGLSASRLSRLLSTAAATLGLPSAFDAVRLVGGLTRRTAPEETGSLTSAERTILGLLHSGLSNREIARARGRSERTVANQVASLLRKTGVPGRRALRLVTTSPVAGDAIASSAADRGPVPADAALLERHG
jgi:DNA-binding CsgD family transcriptional regulator